MVAAQVRVAPAQTDLADAVPALVGQEWVDHRRSEKSCPALFAKGCDYPVSSSRRLISCKSWLIRISIRFSRMNKSNK